MRFLTSIIFLVVFAGQVEQKFGMIKANGNLFKILRHKNGCLLEFGVMEQNGGMIKENVNLFKILKQRNGCLLSYGLMEQNGGMIKENLLIILKPILGKEKADDNPDSC